MKKKISARNIILAVAALLLIAQLFRIDKTNAPVDPGKDFIHISKISDETASILKRACYDCHSDEVTYPWYTNIAPFSWWIKHHVNEGRHHLNFSIWGTYTSRRMDHKLEECVEMVEEGEMPMSSYTWMHKDAVLTKEQRDHLIAFFNGQRTHESDKK